MTEFIVELYAPKESHAAVEVRTARARAAAENLAQEGTCVRFVRSVFIPEDETCFLLYEAESADAVHEAARRANLPVDRVAAVAVNGTREDTT